jgi:copper chaperone CopZ
MEQSLKSTSLTLAIDGMSCGHCVQAVTAALSGVPSLELRSVKVGSAEVEVLRPSAADDAIAALKEAGYAARIDPTAQEARKTRPGGCCGGPTSCCG